MYVSEKRLSKSVSPVIIECFRPITQISINNIEPNVALVLSITQDYSDRLSVDSKQCKIDCIEKSLEI